MLSSGFPAHQHHPGAGATTGVAHNAPGAQQAGAGAAAMSYSYGPTVVYPAFTMAEAFTGCYAPNAAKENNFAAFGAAPAAKEAFVVFEESSCGHSTGQQASSTTGRVPLGERTNNSTSTSLQPGKRPSGAAPLKKPARAAAAPAPTQQWKDIDTENKDNPLACSEYAQSIFEYLKDAELAHRPNPDYVFNVQRDMTPHMRRILIDWLVEVAQEYRLTSDTLHLTLDLLNRYLSVAPVAREELQLAGIACMWVASKFEEIYAPTARNFCYITDNTYDVGQLVDMEARVLATLGFTLAGPTAKTFQRRFLQAAAADEQLHYLAAFLLELSLMDEQLLHLLPSQVAAGSVYLARAMLGRAPWDATLAHYSGHAEADVGPVAAELAFTHHTIAADGSFGAILDKYSSERLLCVSGLPAHALMSRCTRWAAHQVAAAAAAATAGSSSSDDEAHGSPAGAAGGMCSEASSDMELV